MSVQFDPHKRWNVYELKRHPFFNVINNNESYESSINNMNSRFTINSKNEII